MLIVGAQLTYTQFDENGQECGKTIHQTTRVEKVNDKVIATLEMSYKKGGGDDQHFNTMCQVTCADGIIGIGLVRFFDATIVTNHEGADFNVEIDGGILELKEKNPFVRLRGSFIVQRWGMIMKLGGS
ncbi:hypothetical protein MWU59_10225 [Flavobacteriaceae bacterium F08102]|nr:hypothetical protein [Flavobacteriaceae bacterium F08102]